MVGIMLWLSSTVLGHTVESGPKQQVILLHWLLATVHHTIEAWSSNRYIAEVDMWLYSAVGHTVDKQ